MGSATDNLTQLRHYFGLVIGKELGVTDDVHEKDMSDLKINVRCHVTGIVGC